MGIRLNPPAQIAHSSVACKRLQNDDTRTRRAYFTERNRSIKVAICGCDLLNLSHYKWQSRCVHRIYDRALEIGIMSSSIYIGSWSRLCAREEESLAVADKER